MNRRSKRYRQMLEKINRSKRYNLGEAVGMLKGFPKPKTNETIKMSANLGVDPKHADQIVRSTVMFPHGLGKTVRILVITKGEKEKEAKAAGADFVGAEDYIEKIMGGWLDVDIIVATPDMMSSVGKLGKILGTRGLMPNPKSGTVTPDVTRAIKELKAGRVEYRVDKDGNISVPIGKFNFEAIQIEENANAFLDSLRKARPNSVKGQYVRSLSISTGMGPGIHLETTSFN